MQPSLIDDYRFNVDEEEEEEMEEGMTHRRRGKGWLGKVLAGVGSVVTLALVTGGAIVAASLLNSGYDEHSARRANADARQKRVPSSKGTAMSPGPQAPPYLPNSPFVFRG